ncbi:MAG TPA: peptidyl-prolyl cis-trans isomerase [Polyangiaceae bacterium]|nr:peptidyl-prolyl cis-trans isomerase [Polyangiaceae bacterium]
MCCCAVLACEHPLASTSNAASSSVGATTDPAPKELTAEQLDRVLAKVGDRVITLRDYKGALERMDRFERLRYQSPERRRLLLDEMINIELLAREAERRGLDKTPEVQAELRLVQRQEAERRLRATLPKLSELPASEVRAYYDDHAAEFKEPERRRIAILRSKDRASAEKLLSEAKVASPEQWGDLVRQHSVLAVTSSEGVSKDTARPPREFEGDLGFASLEGTPEENPLIKDAIRQAAFRIKDQGSVLDEVVAHDGWFDIVRLLAVSSARQRTFAEAETNIRARLLEQRFDEAEKHLVAELEQKLPVVVNEAMLAELSRPAASAP